MSKSEEKTADKDADKVVPPLPQNAPSTSPAPVTSVNPTQEPAAVAATEDKAFERLSLLYQENAKVAAIFWDWRNKVITYFAVSIAALATLAGWFYQQKLGRPISFPLFIGAILCVVLSYLDQRNAEVLKATYECGKDIEIELIRTKPGNSLIETGNTIFKLIGEAHRGDRPNEGSVRRGITYTKVLNVTLLLISAFLGALGVANLIWPNL